ncbi:hypothetical protein LX66_2025 [Chitinophaga japonensis]|uniref:Uncharacterized protein n=2 Tax=Chitinophaga japonensis TaxID=104662 RepID=A0A562T2W6_CHIJA|nr:hypothetical protein LX66_2025 [Chitinophaga japonensis]
MNKSEQAQIKELKANIDGVHRFTDGTDKYGMLIIARGELLFFQENDKGLLCEISARYSLINPKTIKQWDNGDKISEEEKDQILAKIIHFYKIAYKNDLTVYKE